MTKIQDGGCIDVFSLKGLKILQYSTLSLIFCTNLPALKLCLIAQYIELGRSEWSWSPMWQLSF